MSAGSEDPETEATELPPPPAWLEPLAREHGDLLHRYCAAMVGDEAAVQVLATSVALVIEQIDPNDDAPLDLEARRQTVLAVAHNRCVDLGRAGGRPTEADIERGDPQGRAAMRALAGLRPIGRDVTILRQAMGLPWSELSRVCGQPRARLVLQTCRAWRRLVHAAEGRSGPAPLQRPSGRTLGEQPEQWASIRDDARSYVTLRQALREALQQLPGAPPGWEQRVGAARQRLRDEARAKQQQQAERIATRQAEQHEAARAKAAAEAEARRAAERAAAEQLERERAERERAAAEAEARAAAHRRAVVRRWLMLAVAIAMVGLAARWIAMP